MAFVLWVGLDPDFAPPAWLGDKLQHVLAFVAVAALAALTWPQVSSFLLFAGLLVFALAIEGIQWGMDLGREADLADFLVGVAAAAVTLLCVFLCRRIADARSS